MKLKLLMVMLAIMVLAIPPSAGAAIVDETTGWITGTEGVVFEFTADVSPYTYEAILTDLSISPFFGFDFLFFSISSSTGTIDSTVVDLSAGQDSLKFDVSPGQKLFANIFGVGGGDFESGNYGLQINAVPIPSALMMLGSGLLALVALKRRN